MAVLVGEAKEAADNAAEIRGGDEQIGEMEGEAITYNDYFNESSDQGSYVESSEDEDSVDSDFVTDEEQDDEEEDEDAERDVKDQERSEKRKKKGAYVDPSKRAAKMAKHADSDSDSDAGSTRGARRMQARSTVRGAEGSGAGRQSFRSTTRMRSEASKAAATEAAQRRKEESKSRPQQQEERRLTQEELLEEAKLTALENEKDLQRLQRIEDDLKKVVWTKPALTGPRIVSISTRDKSLITFSDPSTFPPLVAPPAAPTPAPKAVCVVTGQPAKYRCPRTGQPYATVEAFAKIRASHPA